MVKHVYTHRDAQGMRWRYEGTRPISELADKTMADVERDRKDARRKEETARDVERIMRKRKKSAAPARRRAK